MYKKFLALILGILFCERGDNSAEGAEAGQGGASPEAGEAGEAGSVAAPVEDGDPTPGGLDDGAGGQGNEPPAAPKYGQFGDEPSIDDIFAEYTRLASEKENLTSKTTKTEQNSAALKKVLADSGIQVLSDGQGNFFLQPVQKDNVPKKTRRFTDQHKQLFDAPVYDAMQLLLQDFFEDHIEGYMTTQKTQARAAAQFNKERGSSVERMYEFYPSLNSDKQESFNQAFHTRAEEIMQQKYVDKNGRITNPQGDLLAAMEAATELGVAPAVVSPKVVAAAQKDGYQKGKQAKKILSPVISKQAGSTVMRKLNQAEYLALTPEKRESYDKWNLQQKK